MSIITERKETVLASRSVACFKYRGPACRKFAIETNPAYLAKKLVTKHEFVVLVQQNFHPLLHSLLRYLFLSVIFIEMGW